MEMSPNSEFSTRFPSTSTGPHSMIRTSFERLSRRIRRVESTGNVLFAIPPLVVDESMEMSLIIPIFDISSSANEAPKYLHFKFVPSGV